MQRTGERGHARPVTTDNGEAGCRPVAAPGHGAGEISNDESFSAVGDACQCEGPARAEKFRRIARRAHRAPSPLRLKSRSRRNNAVS